MRREAEETPSVVQLSQNISHFPEPGNSFPSLAGTSFRGPESGFRGRKVVPFRKVASGFRKVFRPRKVFPGLGKSLRGALTESAAPRKEAEGGRGREGRGAFLIFGTIIWGPRRSSQELKSSDGTASAFLLSLSW